jgi:hypothetical protein
LYFFRDFPRTRINGEPNCDYARESNTPLSAAPINISKAMLDCWIHAALNGMFPRGRTGFA